MAKRQDKRFTDDFTPSKLEPLNYSQERYFSAIKSDDIVIAIGSAGTGKTYIAASIAGDLYNQKLYSQIVVTRPTVPCGEDLGALPGSLDEKFDPWVQQVLKPIKQRMSAGKFDCDYGKKIQALPMQYMRGETFDDAIVIVDESQNATKEQMIMLTTRIGLNSKLIICGDTKQSDLHNQNSGLAYIVNAAKKYDQSIEIIEFTIDDCVRSDLCKRMLLLHEKAS